MVQKTKPLYVYFHKYEAEYGELSQIKKLEQRMNDLFPNDPKLLRFASRYAVDGFDPTAIRPIISPKTQMKPKIIRQSIEQPVSVVNSPRPQYREEKSPRPTYLHTTNSPKRPYPGEESDSELNRPRKLARGESPLKGAAGRRLDQQKRLQQGNMGSSSRVQAAPFVVPRDITFLLSIIPRAELYNSTKFNAEAMVRLLAQTNVPDYGTWRTQRDAQFGNGKPPESPSSLDFTCSKPPLFPRSSAVDLDTFKHPFRP
jgi:cleavage stimulation factor subunit 3